jgi:hypothetical protein
VEAAAGADEQRLATGLLHDITLLELPPYSPELNPVERVWHYLRSHWLPTRYFVAWRTSWMPARRLEPVCRRSRLDPLALRGPLGSGFAGSVGGARYLTAVCNARDPRIQKITEIRISGAAVLGAYERSPSSS